jgi:hypothetical protein
MMLMARTSQITMLLLNLILLINVTFSTPTGAVENQDIQNPMCPRGTARGLEY